MNEFVTQIRLRYPRLFQQEKVAFLARACNLVEEIGVKNKVNMNFDPQTWEVRINTPVDKAWGYVLMVQTLRELDWEAAGMLARLKLMEVIREH